MDTAENPESQKKYIKTMFNDIASRYDFLNRLLSLRIDVLWRKVVVNHLRKFNPANVLDVATGTADLAIMEAKKLKTKVIGVDISEQMLEIGRAKVNKKNLNDLISLIEADADMLPFENDHFEACTIAFGVRNFSSFKNGLTEIYRVLKKKSPLVVLEFSNPKNFPIKQIYGLYFNKLLPTIGRVISKNSYAYTYLPKSVSKFPNENEFVKLLEEIGFRNVEFKKKSFGIATLYFAVK